MSVRSERSRADLLATNLFGELEDHLHECPLSPQSERMADCVLGQPFSVSHQASATLDAVRAAMGAQAGAEAEDEMAAAIRSLQELSSEGSLEGFSDTGGARPHGHGHGPASPAASLPDLGVGLSLGLVGHSGKGEEGGEEDDLLAGLRSWLAGVWAGATTDLASEWVDLGQVARQAAAALAGSVSGLRDTAAAASESAAQAVVAAVRGVSAARSGALVAALGASTVLAVCGMVAFMARCRQLSSLMRAREREVARLVLRMVNLQDALHTGAGAGSRAGVSHFMLTHTTSPMLPVLL